MRDMYCRWPSRPTAGRSPPAAAGPSNCGRWARPSWRALMDGHTGVVRSVAYSPDGGTLASGGGDHEIRLWEVGTGSLRSHPSGACRGGGIRGVLARWPDPGQRRRGPYTIRHVGSWRPGRRGRPSKGIRAGSSRWRSRPGGGTLATGGWDGAVLLWDAVTGQPRATLKEPGKYGLTGWVWSLAFGPRRRDPGQRPRSRGPAVGRGDGTASGPPSHSTSIEAGSRRWRSLRMERPWPAAAGAPGRPSCCGGSRPPSRSRPG